MEPPIRFGLCCALLVAASQASAVTIGFGNAPDDPFTEYAEAGVTFRAGGDLLRVADSQEGSPALVNAGPFRPWFEAEFADGASSVSVRLGDFGFDDDLLFLEAFDAGRNLLGTSELWIDTEDALMHELAVAVDGIAYVIFGSRTPGHTRNSVYADDFTFEPIAPGFGPGPEEVPEPRTVVSAVSALTIFAMLRRGRRRSDSEPASR